MFFDAMEPVSKVDKQLMGYVMENHKPSLFVVNKWDLLAGDVTTDQWVEYLRAQFPTLSYAPIAFITGRDECKLCSIMQRCCSSRPEREFPRSLNRLILRWSHTSHRFIRQTSEDLRDSSVDGTTDDRTDVQRT